MKLSLFSDFSLRLLMYAAVKGEAFQVDEVADAYGISRHHLAKVVQNLSRLGYLKTWRGRSGGIELARDPASIRLGHLLREMEDEAALVECWDPATNRCRLNGSCRLKGLLREAMNAFYETLDAHTLSDLAGGPWQKRLSGALAIGAGGA